MWGPRSFVQSHPTRMKKNCQGIFELRGGNGRCSAISPRMGLINSSNGFVNDRRTGPRSIKAMKEEGHHA